MGDRHPTNEHGIYSASLYCVYGCWLRGLVVLAVTARRLLVGGKREASASSAVGRDHSGPILMSLQGVSVPSWAYARYLIFSLPLLLILIAEGIDWLAIHVWMGRTRLS